MFNIGNMYRSCELLKKFNKEPRVTLFGETPGSEITLMVHNWGDADNRSTNKIGFVSEIPKGGEFSFEVQLPGNEHIAVNNQQGWEPTEAAAIARARRSYAERKALLEELKYPRKALDFELQHYDRYYDYSDDPRVWASGNAALKRIHTLCQTLGVDPVVELNKNQEPQPE